MVLQLLACRRGGIQIMVRRHVVVVAVVVDDVVVVCSCCRGVVVVWYIVNVTKGNLVVQDCVTQFLKIFDQPFRSFLGSTFLFCFILLFASGEPCVESFVPAQLGCTIIAV